MAGLDPDANPGAIAVDFLPHLIPMTRGILSTNHVRPTRPVSQAELDALYEAAYADEPFVRVVTTPPATKHTTGSNSRPGPRPGRRAHRPDHRDRRRGQPREGRRRPGGPVVQHRPRPARDGRARAASAGARRWPILRRLGDPTALPRVERRGGDCPPGFRAGGLDRRDQGLGSTGPRPRRRDRTAPAAAAAVFTPNAFAAAPVRLSRANLAATSGEPTRRLRVRRARSSRRAAARTPRPGPTVTADQARIGALRLPTRSASRQPRVLHLSTGIIGTRLPLDKVAAWHPGAHGAAHRCRRIARCGRGGAAHDRLGGQGRHRRSLVLPGGRR